MSRRPLGDLRVVLFELLMNSQHALHNSPVTLPKISNSSISLWRGQKLLCFSKGNTSKKLHFLLSSTRFSSVSHACIPNTVKMEETAPLQVTKLSVLANRMAELGFNREDIRPGQQNGLLCPQCKGGESEEKSLSLLVSEDGNIAFFNCFRDKCGFKGSPQVIAGSNLLYKQLREAHQKKKVKKINQEDLKLEPLSKEILQYFTTRLISKETLHRNFVMQRSYKGYRKVIAFTYRRDGVLVGCKYRSINKKFWQKKDSEKIFYGLDDIKESNEIIIVEGEMDKLSMEEAGFRNCVSVPGGAQPPPTVIKELPPVEMKDAKYQYLWNCKEYLDKASRIILATDGDPPGQALAEELARRIGRERCWRVKWPKKNATEFLKDANEVLMYFGPDVLKEVVNNSELYPIKGLFKFQDFFTEIDAYYHGSIAFEQGISTGWRMLDNLYKVVPGELTVVSGVPNSGKSEWIDALLCNINENSGWKFALCSMENKVREHARKLLEKHIKKPFFNTWYGQSVERMTVEELGEGKKWLDDTFHLIRCDNDCLPSIKWVLDLAKSAVLRHGVGGLVIDPYNELDHQRFLNQTETEYVSQMLTMVKRFARHYSCHVWFVAHPRQLHDWNGGPPSLYDISGSAHFVNKCDNGIIIHRNRDPAAGPLDRVQVCVRKVRNKVAGTIGDAYLCYKRETGEYMDLEEAAA